MTSVPVISQIKSIIQILFGDKDGAYDTQDQFTKRCLVLSQLRSTYQWCRGDTVGAWETQREYLRGFGEFLNYVPVVGHIKAVNHYRQGNREEGDLAMKQYFRTTGVMIGGGLGSLIAGPFIGGILGGLLGGVTLDLIITIVDSLVHQQYRPHGYLQLCRVLHKDPTNAGMWCDLLALGVLDSLVGYVTGRLIDNYKLLKQPSVPTNTQQTGVPNQPSVQETGVQPSVQQTGVPNQPSVQETGVQPSVQQTGSLNICLVQETGVQPSVQQTGRVNILIVQSEPTNILGKLWIILKLSFTLLLSKLT